jgi:hypothetical protein
MEENTQTQGHPIKAMIFGIAADLLFCYGVVSVTAASYRSPFWKFYVFMALAALSNVAGLILGGFGLNMGIASRDHATGKAGIITSSIGLGVNALGIFVAIIHFLTVIG